MVANLQCLGDEVNPSILLLPRFCRLHKVSHLEFECSWCQEEVAKVSTQMLEVKSDNISKDEPAENESPINISKSMEKVEEEIKDLDVSYSDTSPDGGGLSSPLPGMIKVQRRR